MVLTADCAVCDVKCFSTYSGLPVCGSCSSFYRRAIIRKIPYKPCLFEEQCLRNLSTIKDCSSCRYKKFKSQIEISKNPNLFSPVNDYQNHSLSMILKDLSDRNISRSINFTTCCVFGDIDPSIQDVIDGNFTLIPTPVHTNFKFQDWAFHCDVTSLQYYSRFDFVGQLSDWDKRILIKDCKMKGCLFKHAADAVFDKSYVLAFPDGSDFLPDFKIDESMDNLLRCRMIFRLKELNITLEEYLLVSMIAFCNSSLTGLSLEAAAEVNRQQQKYSSFLLAYCQLSYQSGAPSRFTELLGLFHLINITHELFCDYCHLLQMSQPPVGWKKLIFEGI